MADLASTYRSLAALHRAGIGWPAALASAAPASEAWALARTRVEQGEPLSRALIGAVEPIDLALLRAGEAGGSLEPALEALSRRHEEAHRDRGRRRAALAYPLMLAHIAALLLPLPDLMQRRLGSALLWFLLPLVPLYGFWLYARRRPTPDRPLPFRFPFSARVEEQDAEALEALGTLYDAGVPLSEALPLARASGPHGRVGRDLVRAESHVARGEPLAAAWRDVPPAQAVGLRTGELTGSLGRECLASAVRLHEDAALRRTRTLAKALPLIMLAIGLIVGARVISFYAGAFRQLGNYR